MLFKYLHQFVSFSCDGIQAWNSFFFGFFLTGFFFRFLFRFSGRLDSWWHVYFGQIFQLLLRKEKDGMKNVHISTEQKRSEVFYIFIGSIVKQIKRFTVKPGQVSISELII